MKQILAALSLATLLLAGQASPSAAEGRRFKDCGQCSDMVEIAPGRFMMGFEGGEAERYEGPVHEVTIGYRFAVGVTPVTNAQFRAFIDATRYTPGTNCAVPKNGTFKFTPGANWRDPGAGRPVRDDEPVVCIDFHDARAYVAWLAKTTGKPYRLLSEAEYEYVARAGSTTAFPWGDDPALACLYGNIADASTDPKVLGDRPAAACNDGFSGLAPVGRFRANAFGVKDMNGNAWSWVEDCYRTPYPAAPIDGRPFEVQGQCDRRSVRGAAWSTTVSRARSSFRGRDDEGLVSALFGVRVALDLPSAPDGAR